MEAKSIALLLMLFCYFHDCSPHNLVTGSNDEARKLSIVTKHSSSGGHGSHGHGHGGGDRGIHGGGNRGNDPTWWQQYGGGHGYNHHSRAYSNRIFSCSVIGAAVLTSILSY